MSFSERVSNYLSGGQPVNVYNPFGRNRNRYRVQLGENRDQVLLLDGPNLKPIPMIVFDIVERCLGLGLTKRGQTRSSKIGELGLDNTTIMYHVGVEGYGLTTGDSMWDAGCYIFSILRAAGCIPYPSRGHLL